jgi:surface antigen
MIKGKDMGHFKSAVAIGDRHESSTLRGRRSAAALLAGAVALGGCATQQDTGTLIGAVGGAAIGAAVAGGSTERRVIGALIGGAAGGFAGSLIGKRLDEADRARAEAAAQKAIAEREAAVAREQQQRNAEIEAQLRAEQAKARTQPERVAAEKRALEARQRVAQTPTTAPPVTWSGNARGSAQAIGPTQVSGREGCEQVREIAVIQGQEVRQLATFCRDPSTGARVRV